MPKQAVDQRTEQVGIAARKRAGSDQIKDAAQLRVLFVDGVRVVAARPQCADLFRGKPEQKEILGSDLVANLDIGAIQRADGESAIERELHVAGAARLHSGRRYLLREIGRRINPLARGDVEVREEHDLQATAHIGVGIEHVGHRAHQLDDQLGHVVARRRLAAEDECARHDIEAGIGLQPAVEGEDVKDVEVLSLVLMDALDLDVEQGVGIDHRPCAILDDFGQAKLVAPLHAAPTLAELRIARARLQPAQRIELGRPGVAELFGDQFGESGIAQHQKATRGHSVRYVDKPVGIHLDPVRQNQTLQEIGVKRGDAVDGMASDAGEIGHSHVAAAVLVDQGHARDTPGVLGVALAHIIEQPAIDLENDLQMARQQRSEQFDRPGFQSLRQQRVVGVRHRLLRHVPCGFPLEAVIIEEEPHQLGDGDGRMGVVQLGSPAQMKRLGRAAIADMAAQHVLHRAGDEEILLFEAKHLALRRHVVRIQDLADRLRGDLLLDGLMIVADVEGGEVERLDGLRTP